MSTIIIAAAAATADQGLNIRSTPDPGLLTNLILRVLFAIVGTILCWVPLRLLHRNGDFAAVVLIADVALMNIFTVINALTWRTDAWNNWWDGAGLCDLEVYLLAPLQTIYAACIFAIVRNLAQQVRPTRAAQMSSSERKRKTWVQAAIIFPVPLFQLLFTWFDLAQRYMIGTLIGCLAVYDNSWPHIVVFDVPSPVFVVASVPFAYLIWKRYRAISKATRAALLTNNRTSINIANANNSSPASALRNRTRWRLYNMSLSILVVYVPVSLYFVVVNVLASFSATFRPYSYARIHWQAEPYPWDAILFVPSWAVSTPVMNQPWITIATTVVIVAFFGTTRDAMDMYLQYAAEIVASFRRCYPRRLRRRLGGRALYSHVNGDGSNYSHRLADIDADRNLIELESGNNINRNRAATLKHSRSQRPSLYHYPYPGPNSRSSSDPSSLLPSPSAPSPSHPLSPSHSVTTPTRPFIPHTFSSLSGSPLERVVIEPLIPARGSSLFHAHHSHGQQQQQQQQQQEHQTFFQRTVSRIPLARLTSLRKSSRKSATATISGGTSDVASADATVASSHTTAPDPIRFACGNSRSDPPPQTPGAIHVHISRTRTQTRHHHQHHPSNSTSASSSSLPLRNHSSRDAAQPRELLPSTQQQAQRRASAASPTAPQARDLRGPIRSWPFHGEDASPSPSPISIAASTSPEPPLPPTPSFAEEEPSRQEAGGHEAGRVLRVGRRGRDI
ncbi:hypothetical protein AAE478_003409 [Parahypoxylon ruwenzoriense]